ncbi:YbhB/YbcL family Raf kinase inhibitor-like protein [Polymorphum gilvum]|uniref:Putative Kinase inhibitor YbhB n=1 Tax=Polymorphum gilvum (strain LMG 25793 / CGMCC 1.9160 / SL003B-26A1) TaxID=991905 RepID=F2J2D2_POLGS|nr:YbhB/YbcL family Raf kinase inhibitor-like protein [Polymorphum gilvum]ADZ69828.1 Putative Kinase inhibitor YbhB [Polymorphum gilvum SL003B-26A1]
MKLTSAAFEDGGTIPRPYTCDGEDLSPPLAWTGAPAGTRSFALVCDDPDAPAGTWHHWAIYDIPAGQAALEEGIDPDVGAQAVNDFRRRGYGGPCPPRGHSVHHYHFRLYALSTQSLAAPRIATVKQVEALARQHALAEARLTGTSKR